MGGKALKTTITRRYERAEFEAIIPEIQEKLLLLFKDAQPTKYYANKESFGDADFLCLVDGPLHTDVKIWLQNNFEPNEIFKNGNVYSFDYQQLQVDLILTPLEDWETSLVYFGFNDLHNLVGKQAHWFGLKWGHRGLIYTYKIEGKVLGEIIITKNHQAALDFLGFSSKVYDEGFNKLDDIFDFVVNTEYFNPWQYDLENLNKINRDRDKKRKTYQGFLEHIKPMKELDRDWYYFYPDKKVYLGLVDRFFPGFMKQYRELEKMEERKAKVKKLFNGTMIMERFGLKGIELGAALSKFQTHFTDKKEMEDWIVEMNDTEAIMKTFKKVNDLHI